MNGKGDTPRPKSVDQQTFADNWERTFGAKRDQSDVSQETAESQSENS